MSADPGALSRARYLDLLEKTLQNAIYGESVVETKLKLWLQRLRHPYLTRRGAIPWPSRAHSMIGPQRLRNLRTLMERTLNEGVTGDYIETGVWRGGACILMRGALAAHGVRDRKVIVADSFEGLPRPDGDKYPDDRRDTAFAFSELAIPVDEVKKNFASYNLLDDQVIFLKGFFKDSLPTLPADSRFALIRLDGDMYESTMDALTHLYDKLSKGGFAIIDDYGGLKNCAKAVHDFLDERGLRVDLHKVDDSCVWWQKA